MHLRRKFYKKVLQFVLFLYILFVVVVFAVGKFAPDPQAFPVLEYHSINLDNENDDYVITADDFCQQLDYLRSEGYETISTLDLMKAKKGKLTLPNKPIIITFDDGYRDNYEVALPILEERGMKATVYVITNNIGKEEYLTWDNMREMQNHGIEIGSHSANHFPMTRLEPAVQDDEMYMSKLLMEWNGINTVFSFSYPNGLYTDDMIEMLKDNEYLTAVTGNNGLNDMQTNPYLLNRINVTPSPLGMLAFKFRLYKAKTLYLFDKLTQSY